MKYAYIYETEIGRVMIAEDGTGITDLTICNKEEELTGADIIMWETDILKEAAVQLKEYLGGKRTEFTLPLNPKGTSFQQQVWEALKKIPYGETRTYKQIAEAVGNPKASRAVGMANHNNPIMCIIPCHRVIGANGSLTGYAGGLTVKEYLLHMEKPKERK